MHRSKWHRYSITRSADTRSPCGRRRDHDVRLIAFDLIELQDDDLRNLKFGRPQATSRQGACSRRERNPVQRASGHDGPAVFEHACRLGLEGIVSKRLDSPYRSGPSKTWLKSKNPLSEARPCG